MNNKALKVFLEIGYIGVMGIFLILTSYHKLSSGHYIIMYFFNVFCIQLMEMFETRMSNFLIYKFEISSFILLFVSFIYLQDVDSYFAHILLLIMVLLLLSNWHFILDNKIYRTYNIVTSIVVTIYSLVGYIIFVFVYICFSCNVYSDYIFYDTLQKNNKLHGIQKEHNNISDCIVAFFWSLVYKNGIIR